MIVIDTNLLIYASVRNVPQYEASHRWLSDRDFSQFPGLRWKNPL